jgi:hypothetical protein
VSYFGPQGYRPPGWARRPAAREPVYSQAEKRQRRILWLPVEYGGEFDLAAEVAGICEPAAAAMKEAVPGGSADSSTTSNATVTPVFRVPAWSMNLGGWVKSQRVEVVSAGGVPARDPCGLTVTGDPIDRLLVTVVECGHSCIQPAIRSRNTWSRSPSRGPRNCETRSPRPRLFRPTLTARSVVVPLTCAFQAPHWDSNPDWTNFKSVYLAVCTVEALMASLVKMALTCDFAGHCVGLVGALSGTCAYRLCTTGSQFLCSARPRLPQ